MKIMKEIIFTVLGMLLAIALIRLGFRMIFMAYGVYFLAKTIKTISINIHKKYYNKKKGCV